MNNTKLVRDLIPDIIKSSGKTSTYYSLVDDTEYLMRLKVKLLEEVYEFLESESPEEIADIYEVIGAICRLKKFSDEKIRAIQIQKRDKAGSFDKKIILNLEKSKQIHQKKLIMSKNPTSSSDYGTITMWQVGHV